jgi:plasmid stabilization system protein ParE
MHKVWISAPAEHDIRAAFEWWRDNRSAEQATRRYIGIRKAISSLRDTPERCAFASETDLRPHGIRQLLFGLRRRPTHRIVFTIVGQDVTVLRLRHAAQDALRIDDIREQ